MCDTDVSKLLYLNDYVTILRDQTSVISVSAAETHMANYIFINRGAQEFRASI